MADSSLVTHEQQAYSGNYTTNRAAQGGSIKKITVHHTVGNMTVQQLGNLWATPGRAGSSHYGVNGSQVGQYVAESDVAWTDSHWTSNITSVTIETANSGGSPNWEVSDASLTTLITLVADVAKRRGLGTLVAGQNLTWHSMYAATACPGPYLLTKMPYIAEEANKINSGTSTDSRFTKGKSFRLQKAYLYSSATGKMISTISGPVYLWDNVKKNGRRRVAGRKEDIGKSDYPARWVNETALVTKRVLGAGVGFTLTSAIAGYTKAASTTKKDSIAKGKTVYIMDGIINNGRIRVVFDKAHAGLAYNSSKRPYRWVAVSSLQKYGV